MCPRWQNLRIRTERDPRGELSAFLVILWHTYQNKRTLGFSAIPHRLVASSTVYFLVMVAAQISVQVSVNLIQVQFPLSILCFVVMIHNRRRASSFHFCKSSRSDERWSSSESPNPPHLAHMDCMSSCMSILPQERLTFALASQVQPDIDSTVRDLADKIRRSRGR